MAYNRQTKISAGLILLLFLHCAWIYSHFEPAIFSPDAHGYLLQTRLLAAEGQTWFVPESDLQHVGIHWYEAEGGRYYSHYPFGMPLLATFLYWLGGLSAALSINILLATLTLLGFFLLCRTWLGDGWSLLAVGAMALNPVFNSHALNRDAHLAVACFLIWGFYLLILWSNTRSPVLALIAGLVWGALPTIRYPAVLYFLAALLLLLWQHRPDRKTWWSYLIAAVGGLIPIGALLWHHQIAFGGFWKTGYSLTNEQTAFAWSHFVQHGSPYIRGILGEGAGLFFPLGIAGMAALCAHATTRRLGLLVSAAAFPITFLYMAYYWSGGGPGGGGASMRFLIPTFFLYTLLGFFLLKTVAAQWPRIAPAAVASLLLLHVGWAIGDNLQNMHRAEGNGARQISISNWLETRVEPGSLIIAQSIIQEQLDLLSNWHLVDARVLPAASPRMRQFRPRQEQEAPAIGPRAAPQKRVQRYRDLSPQQQLERINADLSAWAGEDRKIFWVVPQEQFRMSRRELSDIATFAVADTLELAEGIQDPGRFGRMTPGGAGPFPLPPGGRIPRMGRMGSAAGGNLLLVEWTPLVSAEKN